MKIACTIAIPVYNREQLVRGALESALAQQTPGHELEILVVDNCSTDATWKTLQGYADPRLRLIRNDSNIGLYGNLNRCLELAQGEYVRILCSDDRLEAGCIAREIACMAQHPSAVLLSTRGREVDVEGRLLRVFADELPAGVYAGEEMIGNLFWLLAHYNSNPLNYPSGILLKRAATIQAGQFVNTYRLIGDLDYWLRLFTLGDVIIADHIGCDIMLHKDQEGQAALLGGGITEEIYALAAQWQAQLQQRGMDRRVRRQFAGCALYTAARLWGKEKRPDVARLYWQSALRSGFSAWELVWAAAYFTWMVQSRKRGHACALPPIRARSLEAPAC